jgi:prevent-host-death family protein
MGAYNIYEAKTSLSKLVDKAMAGEEVIIAKAGTPMVRIVPLEKERRPAKRKSGRNYSGITYIGADFDDPLPDEILRGFGYK